MTATKYLLATGNPHKTEELRRLLGSCLNLIDLSELPALPEPVEDGASYLENALIKSRYYCQATGLVALADDSGLEVDALDKQPGIHSSRFGGTGTPHSAKMALILDLLKDTPEGKRSARFCCAAVATFPDGREFHAFATLEGVISQSVVGDGGFGYDPIVFLPELNRSVAELSDLEKDEWSHRGKAFRQLLATLPSS